MHGICLPHGRPIFHQNMAPWTGETPSSETARDQEISWLSEAAEKNQRGKMVTI